MKILFFARDVRGGLGERRVFRTLFRWLAVNYPESVKKNVSYVADYGRFDDLLVLIGTPCQSAMVEFWRKLWYIIQMFFLYLPHPLKYAVPDFVAAPRPLTQLQQMHDLAQPTASCRKLFPTQPNP